MPVEVHRCKRIAMSEKYAIITAGGLGTRMGTPVPKQFLELNGLPVIMHSMQAFAKYSNTIRIILVLPAEWDDGWSMLCEKYDFQLKHAVCYGGKTRFQSVKNGLKHVKTDGLVAIHDAVRPLLETSLIETCYEAAQQMGNAIPAIPLVDSIRELRGGESRPVDRDHFRLIQTPQVFDAALIRKAYDQAYRASFTDDATVLESIGVAIHLVEGNRKNIKITSPEDLIVAKAFL
jgi:2-C-methyl-D-erythritol 4-phosphate cytidylyltransferase